MRIKTVDRLFRNSLSDSGYLSEKKNEEASYMDENSLDDDDIEEDPYRWVILFSGFLAQAISMCTLSSW